MEYKNINIIKETKDLSIFIAEDNGNKFFYKKPRTKDGEIKNTREFNNQKFLLKITHEKNVGFEFLEPKFEDKTLIYPDINQFGVFLAKSEAPADNHTQFSTYSEEMIKFIKFCLQIPYSGIPEAIKIDSQTRKNNILNKFNTDGELLASTGLISKKEINNIENIIGNGLRKMAFQHHDLVPWHMARKTEDQKLILIDSGWSGWSLKYYDVAYYVLQMTGYARKKDDAFALLEKVKNEFRDDAELHSSLAASFGYRGIRLAAELERIGKIEEAKDVIIVLLSQINE
ncbi:MAG: hypothetical protein WC457_03780 [Patescibacteria group bacterium]